MAVGDYCDQNIYVVDYVDFSNNPETIVEFVRGVRGTSGGFFFFSFAFLISNVLVYVLFFCFFSHLFFRHS